MNDLDDKVRYAIICDRFPNPDTYYDSYETALMWAKREQPMHRPHYIVKCTESYEICSVVNEKNSVFKVKRKGLGMTRNLIMWQYCRDPNDINKAIINLDSNWEGLIDASQIISITYDTNHGCYVVFWTVNDTGVDE